MNLVNQLLQFSNLHYLVVCARNNCTELVLLIGLTSTEHYIGESWQTPSLGQVENAEV